MIGSWLQSDTGVSPVRAVQARARRPCHREHAFTLVELMVLLGILIILLSIFIPYVLRYREMDRRTRCAENLKQIYDALTIYQQANRGVYPRVVYDESRNPTGYTAFTGADDPDPFAPGSAVQPNDVTASLWLLVRLELLKDPAVFVCPSSSDVRDVMTDGNGRMVKPTQRGNFRRPNSLSYAYCSPFSNAPEYRLNENRGGDFALLADKGPRVLVDESGANVGPAFDTPTLELSRANSPNHGRAGQNVLHSQGRWVYFERTPYSGAGRVWDKATNQVIVPGDNIYTALAPKPLAQDQQPSPNSNGYWGRRIGPAWKDDSYLVPTVDDEPLEPPGTSEPSTMPAPTTTTTTTAPPTQPATVPASQPPAGAQ